MAGTLQTLEGNKAASIVSTTSTSVYDMYASLLNYKKTISEYLREAVSICWVPSEHQRRLKAYELLHAYWDNYSRDFRQAPETGTDDLKNEISEQGDCWWFCEKLKNKLLGDKLSVSLSVPAIFGDEEFYAKMLADTMLDANLKSALFERQKQFEAAKRICILRERYLQWWFEDQNIFNTINMNESKCSALGDCVYMLGWEDNTVVLKTFDPAFCFPKKYYIPVNSWDETINDKVIERFIVAWEEETISDNFFLLYREVYELRTNGKVYRQKSYFQYGNSASISIEDLTDEEMTEDSDSTWEDIGLDFIPYVWIPNIAREGEEPFGISNIFHVIDLIDKLLNNETNLSINAEYLGGAIVGLSGKNIRLKKDTSGDLISIPIRPRTAFMLGEDGRMTLVDTANMQTALLATLKYQTEKLLKILDMPDIVAGKTESAGQLSGLALRILMQPLIDRINPIRADRQKRYATLFYYIQKFFAIYGDDYEKLIFAGDLFDVKLNFGELIPMDEKAEIEMLNSMKGLFSDKTVLTKAKESGIVNFDIDTELELLKEKAVQDAANAQSMFDFRMNQDKGLNTTSNLGTMQSEAVK